MPDDIGSFAEEAAKLADAVQGWARGEGHGRVSQAVGHMATGDPACCVCPVCTVIVLLRGERPELTGRLVESLAGLVTAGQGLLDTLAAATAEVRATGAQANGGQADPGPAGGAQGNGDASGATGAAGNGGPGRRVQDIPLDDD